MAKKRHKTHPTPVYALQAERRGMVSFGVKQERGGVKSRIATKPVVFFCPHAPKEGYPDPAHGMFRVA